ncbi:hypothetical protein [Streptomyces sp. NPDC007083]
MPGVSALVCPNCDDAVQMESDAHGVHADTPITTHTCTECGYSEIR